MGSCGVVFPAKVCHRENAPRAAELAQGVHWGWGSKRVKGWFREWGHERGRHTDRQTDQTREKEGGKRSKRSK